jgi:hypothetical protein
MYKYYVYSLTFLCDQYTVYEATSDLSVAMQVFSDKLSRNLYQPNDKDRYLFIVKVEATPEIEAINVEFNTLVDTLAYFVTGTPYDMTSLYRFLTNDKAVNVASEDLVSARDTVLTACADALNSNVQSVVSALRAGQGYDSLAQEINHYIERYKK